ncbi:energy transducer TonB [Flavobacterium tibetense]|uniref:Energy transducer TonB n=1 Tax=Flavobacterium tibetense TaxID=2233533 RepID=A0A365NZQ9_9FLAO|nr:energy transducer TonB [Flavobacterium tibetense]RBA27745.1 energy transducer TonB [Flavobacterium tibetense]
MELKKNPNVDPKRNSTLFFQVGLVAILLISYIGIELKSEDPREDKEDEFVTDNIVVDDDEAIITLPPIQRLPPPPPPAPEVIEVVKDEIKLEDKKIETTEVEENKPVVIVKASDVGGDGDADDFDGELPFAVIEDIPLFPGCETVPKAKRLECFNEQMAKHIKKHFSYPSRAADNNIQGRVSVQFVIDKQGNVIDIQTRGPQEGELLEKEAQRIISKLPKFTPGKQRGKPVKVKYGLPINFTIR